MAKTTMTKAATLDYIADQYNSDKARVVDREVHTRNADGHWVYRCDVTELPTCCGNGSASLNESLLLLCPAK